MATPNQVAGAQPYQYSDKQLFVRLQYPGPNELKKPITSTDLENVLETIGEKLNHEYDCALGSRLFPAATEGTDSAMPQGSSRGQGGGIQHLPGGTTPGEVYFSKTYTTKQVKKPTVFVEIYVNYQPDDRNTIVSVVKEAITTHLIDDTDKPNIHICIMNFFIGKT